MINENGDVKSIRYTKNNIKIEKLLKPCTVGRGYLSVCLCKQGRVTRRYIHRLVAEHFVPNPYNLPVVNHMDGNKLNNRYNNLEWVTYSTNNCHAYDKGLKKKGENFYNSKLRKEQVDEKRKFGKYGTFQTIADKYGVSKATIRDVLLNRTW